MLSPSSWGPADSVPSSTFTPQDPTVEQVRLAAGQDVTFVMASGADRAFLVQKLLAEASVDLRLNKSVAVLLVPKENRDTKEDEDADDPHESESRERVRLWSEYVQRVLDQDVLSLPKDEDKLTTLLEGGGILVATPKDIVAAKEDLKDVSLVIVDNAQVFLGGESLALVKDLKTKLMARDESFPPPKWVAITSSLGQMGAEGKEGFSEFSLISRTLIGSFPGRVETSCELTSLLRHSASPRRLCVVRHGAPDAAAKNEEDVRREIFALLDSCSSFLDSHNYSLFETYGDEFMDLIEDIPDPAEVPRTLLLRFRRALDSLGLYCADRAALLLVIQLERLKMREKYERHFLLHGMLYTTLMLARKAVEEEFDRSGLLPDDPEALIRKYSAPKLLKLVDILLQFKPEHVGASRYGGGRHRRDRRGKFDRQKASSKDRAVKREEKQVGQAEPVKEPAQEDESCQDHSAKSSADAQATDEPQATSDPPTAKNAKETAASAASTKQTGTGRRGHGRKHPYSSYEDPDSLHGIIFVRDRFHAQLLYHFLKDLSRSDDRFSFLSPQYIVANTPDDGDVEPGCDGDDEAARRKQEESLRRFRMKESNLLISNSLLEVGIETVRCNLVLAFDTPEDFMSFAYQKVKARNKNASIVFMEQEASEGGNIRGGELKAKLASFCSVEKTLLDRCSYKDPSPEEVLEADQMGDSWLPSEYRQERASKISPALPGPANQEKANDTDPPIAENNAEDSNATVSTPVPAEAPQSRRPHHHHYHYHPRRGGRHGQHGGIPVQVNLRSAIHFLNRYCARLPSDTFTRLTPLCAVREVRCKSTSDVDSDATAFVCAVQLPVNSSLREVVVGPPAPSETLAKRAAALEVLRRLRALKEVDEGMAPIGKEKLLPVAAAPAIQPVLDQPTGSGTPTPPPPSGAVVAPTSSSATVAPGLPRPPPGPRDFRTGTTKRRQYYYKQVARSLTTTVSPSEDNEESYRLYAINLRLTCAIPEDQNTRGRRIYPPENAEQSFGFLSNERIPEVCPFPIYTRSGEVLVNFVLLEDKVRLEREAKESVLDFHQYTFSQVLRMEKYPMEFSPDKSDNSVMIVPLRKEENNESQTTSGDDGPKKSVDWKFLELIGQQKTSKLEVQTFLGTKG